MASDVSSPAPQQHEAEEYDAAIVAADERMTKLWSDLRGLAEATTFFGEAATTASCEGKIDERDARMSMDWEALFGGDSGDDGDGGCVDIGCLPQPREQPVVTQPSSRSPSNSAPSAAVITPSTWQTIYFGGSDTEAGTRIRTICAGSSGAGVATAVARSDRTTCDKTRPSPDAFRLPPPQPQQAAATRDSRSANDGARDKSADPALRHAIDDIISGGRLSSLLGDGAAGDALHSGEGMLENERKVTLELREGVAQLRAKQHQKVVDQMNAQKRLEIKRREEENEKQFEAESARPLPPVPVTEVIFHRAVQTVVESRSESTQTVVSGDICIDAWLLDDIPGVTGSGRLGRKQPVQEAPPWGGGSGKKRRDRVGLKPKWESAVNVRKRPATAAGDTSPSRFEERCSLALSRHLSSLDTRQRQLVMDDWGAADGGFEGAELCIRIEVTAVAGGDCAERSTPILGGGNNESRQRFIPVQPQPLRQLRLYLGSPTSSVSVDRAGHRAGHLSLGWIKVDYDDNGCCQLPALCACVMYRERRSDKEETGTRRHFLHFSFRQAHGRIFRRACLDLRTA